MPIRGKVKNGKVLLDDPQGLADGTEVEVRPVAKRKKPAKPAKCAKNKGRPRSLAERLANVMGKARACRRMRRSITIITSTVFRNGNETLVRGHGKELVARGLHFLRSQVEARSTS